MTARDFLPSVDFLAGYTLAAIYYGWLRPIMKRRISALPEGATKKEDET